MSKKRVFTSTLLLALVSGGCSVGPRIEAVDAANTPAGIATVVRTADATYEGELLSVTDDGLLLLVADRLMSVSFDVIVDIDARPVLRVHGPSRSLNPPVQHELLSWSRFPQGVSRELERSLLGAYGQTEVIRIER